MTWMINVDYISHCYSIIAC